MTKHIVAQNCLQVRAGYGGNVEIVIGSTVSNLRVHFEAGEQVVLSRGEDGLLVLSVQQSAAEPEGEPAENIEWRDCEIAFNAIQNYLGSETAHLSPAEQYHVFKRVARACERDCDDMVREAASPLNRGGEV